MREATGQLYSVTELGLDLGVTARTIRFYEDKGLIAPQRAGNNRVYTQRDRARMILILRGKKLGFTLREIKEYLDLYDADPTHAKQLRLLLGAVRSRILQLEDQRVALHQAIAELHEVEAQARDALATLDSDTQHLISPSRRGGLNRSTQQ
ncbi:MAG: MerR family DNA-binding transcriptional regulator [Pseudomonadota bacterium]|nr:MerR family DNA-binding transcriptional regulator [Pseudomonadota bacterium]